MRTTVGSIDVVPYTLRILGDKTVMVKREQEEETPRQRRFIELRKRREVDTGRAKSPKKSGDVEV